jgi:hypothetical protein
MPTMPTMTADGDRPPARRAFRRLAAVAAVLCFVLIVVYSLALDEGRWLFVGVCLFVGFVMATIATTGYLLPRR